jgi:hypothetical protein
MGILDDDDMNHLKNKCIRSVVADLFQDQFRPQKKALALLAKRFERRTYRQGPDRPARPLSLPVGRLARYSFEIWIVSLPGSL